MECDLGSGLTDGNVLAGNSQPAWSRPEIFVQASREGASLDINPPGNSRGQAQASSCKRQA